MAICDDGSDVDTRPGDGDTPNSGPPELNPGVPDAGLSGCANAKPVIEMPQGQKTVLTLYVLDRNGTGVDISSDDITRVRFMVKELVSGSQVELDKDATKTSGNTEGQVTVDIAGGEFSRAGLFHAQVLAYNVDDALLWATDYWLSSNPALEALGDDISEPVAIAEVRMMMRDVCASENLLLGELEFDDTQVAYAIRWPISEFNETNQPKTQFSVRTFPYRFHHLRAACGYLMDIGARGYARDHLPYSAGGISVDDKAKASPYNQLAQSLLAEWRNFIVSQKLQLNIANGYSSVRSPYSYRTASNI